MYSKCLFVYATCGHRHIIQDQSISDGQSGDKIYMWISSRIQKKEIVQAWSGMMILKSMTASKAFAPNVRCLISGLCWSASWQAARAISTRGRQTDKKNPWSSLLLVLQDERTDGPHPKTQALLFPLLSSRRVLNCNNSEHSLPKYLHPNALILSSLSFTETHMLFLILKKRERNGFWKRPSHQ